MNGLITKLQDKILCTIYMDYLKGLADGTGSRVPVMIAPEAFHAKYFNDMTLKEYTTELAALSNNGYFRYFLDSSIMLESSFIAYMENRFENLQAVTAYLDSASNS